MSLCVFVYFNLQPPCPKLVNWVVVHQVQTWGRSARQKTSRAMVVVNTFNWEAEAGGSLWVQDQPGLQSKSQDRHQSYRETLSHGEKKKKAETLEHNA